MDLLVRFAVGSVVASAGSLSGVELSSQCWQIWCSPSRRRRAAVRVSPVTSGEAASTAATMPAPVVSSAVPAMANPPSSNAGNVIPARS